MLVLASSPGDISNEAEGIKSKAASQRKTHNEHSLHLSEN